jgi:hypothetical protein
MIEVDRTMDYEKALGLYNAHGRESWPDNARWDWLTKMRSEYPGKPFAWVKAIEETISTGRDDRLDGLVKTLPDALLKDPRIRTMLATAGDAFGRSELAVEHARAAVALGGSLDNVPRVAARVLLAAGLANEAAQAAGEDPDINAGNIAEAIAAWPTDSLPYFYDY